MNLSQTRLDAATAVAPPLAASVGAFAAPKSHNEAVIGSPFDADPAQGVAAAPAEQAVPCNPQPTGIEVMRTGAVAVRISAATLAAAHRVTLFHAEAQAARAVRPMHAEFGAGRASPAPSDGRADAISLPEEGVSLPATQAPA